MRREREGGNKAGKRHVHAVGTEAHAAARGHAREAFDRGADLCSYLLRHSDEERELLIVVHTVYGKWRFKGGMPGNIGNRQRLIGQALVKLCDIHRKGSSSYQFS